MYPYHQKKIIPVKAGAAPPPHVGAELRVGRCFSDDMDTLHARMRGEFFWSRRLFWGEYEIGLASAVAAAD